MQRRRRVEFEAEQVSLFHSKRERPAWESLASHVRREVTKLVARMLLEHHHRSQTEASEAVASEAEVSHD